MIIILMFEEKPATSHVASWQEQWDACEVVVLVERRWSPVDDYDQDDDYGDDRDDDDHHYDDDAEYVCLWG